MDRLLIVDVSVWEYPMVDVFTCALRASVSDLCVSVSVSVLRWWRRL